MPMPSLGRDPKPFRIERIAELQAFSGASVTRRRYVYRFEREPSGTTEALRAVFMNYYGPTIVVGDKGTALVRDPTQGWIRELTYTKENLYAVVRIPFRPDQLQSEELEKNVPHIAVGSRGAALARYAGGVWRAERTETNKDLFGLYHDGAKTFAVGAGGVMLQRSLEGAWQSIPTRTTADLYAVGPCKPLLRTPKPRWPRVCAVGAGGTVVDCVRDRAGLDCVPRSDVASADLRAITDDGFVFGQGAALAPSIGPEEMPPPLPFWQTLDPMGAGDVQGDEVRAAWSNHSAQEHVAVGRGGVVWFISNYREKPFERLTLPFGVDLNGVAFWWMDGFLAGDKGTIVHVAVDGIEGKGRCFD